MTGATTLTGALEANGGASIDNIQIGVTDDNEIDTASGNLTIDSAGGATIVDDIFRSTGSTSLATGGGSTTTGGALSVTGKATVGTTLDVTGSSILQ